MSQFVYSFARPPPLPQKKQLKKKEFQLKLKIECEHEKASLYFSKNNQFSILHCFNSTILVADIKQQRKKKSQQNENQQIIQILSIRGAKKDRFGVENVITIQYEKVHKLI